MSIPAIQHIIDITIAPSQSITSDIQQCLVRCKQSQKSYLFNWKYKIWTEEDFKKLTNTKEWYIPSANKLLTMGAWAIISDILRLYALYTYGGIYLDWDVELIQAIPTHMLTGNTIIGFEPYTYAGRATVQVGAHILLSQKMQNIWKYCYKKIQDTLWTEQFNILPTLLTQSLELHFNLPLFRNQHGYYYLHKSKHTTCKHVQNSIMLQPQEILYPNIASYIPFAHPRTRYTVAIHWEHSQMVKRHAKQRSWTSYLHALQSSLKTT